MKILLASFPSIVAEGAKASKALIVMKETIIRIRLKSNLMFILITNHLLASI